MIQDSTVLGKQQRISDRLMTGLFFVCLGLNLYYCLSGFYNPLLDFHSFRQTQTALTAFYFVQEGYRLDYLTPVLSAPWQIPLEFPLVQWMAACLRSHSSIPLDQCGRIISLIFFYLSLFPVYAILKRVLKHRYYPLFILCFILLDPIYIFWSRTFMIESAALFFCALYAQQALAFLYGRKYRNLIGAILVGVIAAMVKITTLIPFVLFTMSFYLWHLWQAYRTEQKIKFSELIWMGLMTAIPVGVFKVWLSFSEALKKGSTYAYELTSAEKLGHWNYGTIGQKLSPMVWAKILFNSGVHNYIIPTALFYLFSAVVLYLLFRKNLLYNRYVLLALFFYFAAPALLTNLHFVHTYYTYSNSVFLCAAVGLSALSLLLSGRQRFRQLGVAFTAATLVFFLTSYLYVYHGKQVQPDTQLLPACTYVKQHTAKDEVIMVYGNDWGAEYAYYSERKTVSVINRFERTGDPRFQELMQQNPGIRTLVFVDNKKYYDRAFLEDLVHTYHFKLVYQSGNTFIYKTNS
jgi:uncharacterized membrane protein